MELSLPSSWQLLSKRSSLFPCQLSVRDMTIASLSQPISSPLLEDMVSPWSRVAIISDDETRPTPVREILAVVLEKLESKGVSREMIRIIIAGATHAPMTNNKIAERVGADIFSRYHVSGHDCHAHDLVKIASLSNVDVKINREVAASDIKIGIGSVLPHLMSGFSGGPKIIMPAVCDNESIRRHHLVNMFKEGTGIGKIENNPFYSETRRIAQLAGLSFIINCVFDGEGNVVKLVAGDPLKAHEIGADLCKKGCGRNIEAEADISIVNSAPYTHFPHTLKAIYPAYLCTRKGGTIIFINQGNHAIPRSFLALMESIHQRKPTVVIPEYLKLRTLHSHLPLDSGLVYPSLYMIQKKCRVIFVCQHLKKSVVERLGFTGAMSLDQAIKREYSIQPHAKVYYFCAGGFLLPLLHPNICLEKKIKELSYESI